MSSVILRLLLPCLFPLSLWSQAPTAADIRKAIATEIVSFKIAPIAVFKVEDHKVWTGTDTLGIRVYYPSGKTRLPILYNIHGGALVGGDLETHDNISRVLAKQTGSIVVAIDYRKPPEHPYPAGLTDAGAVYTWIRTNAVSFGGDPGQITVLGDSGGGLLAASLMLRKQPAPAALVLVNPAVDLRGKANPMYTLVASWYLNGQSAADSLASPAAATDLSAFPPTLVITSEKDELKQQGKDFFDRLKAAGVKASWVDLPGLDHLGGLWAAGHPDAQPAIKATVDYILALRRK
ncbi:MAG TPA: alpha/beta hydrolase [Flavisolibacter sp.]|nr:alpha/beta hydrolase [Flavisolibacter sp.]